MAQINTPKTAQELVEKWLPEYEEKSNEYAKLITSRGCEDGIGSFVCSNFSEAMAAFAEVVAKAQREICSIAVTEAKDFIAAAQDVFNARSPIKE